jgi:hypothetical protein
MNDPARRRSRLEDADVIRLLARKRVVSLASLSNSLVTV